jgi:hypothetical protein
VTRLTAPRTSASEASGFGRLMVDAKQHRATPAIVENPGFFASRNSCGRHPRRYGNRVCRAEVYKPGQSRPGFRGNRPQYQPAGRGRGRSPSIRSVRFYASGRPIEGKTRCAEERLPRLERCWHRQRGVDWGGFITKSNPSFVTFFKAGAPLDAQCSVTYRVAPQPSIAAAITDINTSGC